MSKHRGDGHDQDTPAQDTGGASAVVGSETSPAPAETTPREAELETTPTHSEEALQPVPPTREQMEDLRRERDEAKDALLRRRAEFENFRKRAEREQQAAAAEAAADVLRRLLETVDNLERALAAAPGAEDALRRGVELTLHDLQATLEAQGVSVVDPTGQRFDPKHQQALVHEPTPGFEEGMVAEVFRKGYLYKDRLLRPALVKVASGGDSPVDAGGAQEVQ